MVSCFWVFVRYSRTISRSAAPLSFDGQEVAIGISEVNAVKKNNSREFFMYFAPSRPPEGSVLLKGDSN
jgi:hypothetical protein